MYLHIKITKQQQQNIWWGDWKFCWSYILFSSIVCVNNKIRISVFLSTKSCLFVCFKLLLVIDSLYIFVINKLRISVFLSTKSSIFCVLNCWFFIHFLYECLSNKLKFSMFLSPKSYLFLPVCVPTLNLKHWWLSQNISTSLCLLYNYIYLMYAFHFDLKQFFNLSTTVLSCCVVSLKYNKLILRIRLPDLRKHT